MLRANSYTRKMEILQFCLLASELVWRGRTPFFAINSNRFGKPWEFDLGVVGWENDKEITRTRKEEGPSRKIFRIHLKELLIEKLLTRIKTSDKRSKYYSITPLGIIHLIKYGEDKFYFDYKYPWPEKINVIQTLQTFAQQNVKPYKSVVFEKEKFFHSDIDLWDDVAKWLGISLRKLMPHVFSNVEITQENIYSKFGINLFEFFITNGYYGTNKINLASFDFENKDFVKIRELDRPITSYGFKVGLKYEPLKLDDEQFHHYLANLMLCSLIYDYGMLEYDLSKLKIRNFLKKEKRKAEQDATVKFTNELKELPEYFLRILFLFSKHISRLTKNQYELTSGYSEKLNEIQFIKN